MEQQVLVSDIQRFSVNDGPGFRTNVYLKGCTLRCAWCHNPETMAPFREIYWKRRLCVECGRCFEACPRDAIEPPPPPGVIRPQGSSSQRILRDRCDRCMKCVEACPSGALEIVGKSMTVEEILEEVERDRPFYDTSGGGMTLTGGEPTFHAGFAAGLLAAARARGLHCCLDTNGYCDWEVLLGVSRSADIVLYDLKHTDPDAHRRGTGVDNRVILGNLARLSETGKEIWVRIPGIPGFNDFVDLHERASEFLAGLPRPIARVDLLPFHNWCQDKYGWLGRRWGLGQTESLSPVLLEMHAAIYRAKGLEATVGGSGFENPRQALG